MAAVHASEVHAAGLLGRRPPVEIVAANLEGCEEMSQGLGLTGRRGPYTHFGSVKEPCEELRGVLAEAEAERLQDRVSPTRANGAHIFSPTLEGREHRDKEADAAILEAVLAEGPEAAMESRAEHGFGLDAFFFNRDWQVRASTDKDTEGYAERRAHLQRATIAEASVHFHPTLRGEKEHLRTRLVQDVHSGGRSTRQQMAQMARTEMEVLASSCEGALQGEEFDLEQSTALKLAQDREMVTTKVIKQEEEIMRQRAETHKVRCQAENEETIRSGLIGVEGRRSSDEGEFSVAHSEQAEGHVADIGARRRVVPCFERDWRIREIPAVAADGLPEGRGADVSEGRRGKELRSVFPKQPAEALSQHEVQALQQWLVAVNATAGQAAPGADCDLAMARQTVERHAYDVSSRTNPAAELEGLRAQLVAATGGLPLTTTPSLAA